MRHAITLRDQLDVRQDAHEDELQGVPARPQNDQVEPAGAAVGEVGADGCDQDARGGDELRREPPLETATRADDSQSLRLEASTCLTHYTPDCEEPLDQVVQRAEEGGHTVNYDEKYRYRSRRSASTVMLRPSERRVPLAP